MAKSIEYQINKAFISLKLGELEEFTQIDDETIKVMADGKNYIVKRYDKKNSSAKSNKLIINQLKLLTEPVRL